MFYLSYIAAELRRRKGRTFLTALGLGIGVGLVVTVSALSTGLDDAQDKVLKPLTGVGTDLSVTRPLRASGDGNGVTGPGNLSQAERDRLRAENGPPRLGLSNLGKPGEKFSTDTFVTLTQLSFPESQARKIAALDGVESVAAALTVSSLHISGTVPKESQQPGDFQRSAPPPSGQGGPPRAINLQPVTITGVDQAKPELAAVTPGQIQSGSWFSASDTSREAVLNVAYARRKGLSIGERVKFKHTRFRVVGLAKTPLGGSASDVYLKLGQLQKLADRKGRANQLQVRATSASQVGKVEREIEATFAGASVTTSKDLADRIGGSLVDAKNLTNKLGTALKVVGLIAAFLIASLLTLSSVTKRVRELGTLKALGWPQRLVVRQVSGESLAQGALGGAFGAVLGIGGAAIISAIAPSLKATVAQAATQAAGGGPGVFIGPPGAGGGFGSGQVTSGSTHVALSAPVDMSLILLAIGLALLGGLLSGAVGGLRAARLRPADALRHID